MTHSPKFPGGFYLGKRLGDMYPGPSYNSRTSYLGYTMEAHPLSLPTIIATLLLGSVGGCIAYHRYQNNRRRLPPGPPGLPFVGNIFDIPKENEWKVYRTWGTQLGELKRPYLMAQALALKYLMWAFISIRYYLSRYGWNTNGSIELQGCGS